MAVQHHIATRPFQYEDIVIMHQRPLWGTPHVAIPHVDKGLAAITADGTLVGYYGSGCRGVEFRAGAGLLRIHAGRDGWLALGSMAPYTVYIVYVVYIGGKTMPQTKTLSARVPKEFLDEVDMLAKALNRDRAWIVEQAVRQYVQAEAAFLAAVQQGRSDIAADRFVTHEAMDAELDWIDAEVDGRPGTSSGRSRPGKSGRHNTAIIGNATLMRPDVYAKLLWTVWSASVHIRRWEDRGESQEAVNWGSVVRRSCSCMMRTRPVWRSCISTMDGSIGTVTNSMYEMEHTYSKEASVNEHDLLMLPKRTPTGAAAPNRGRLYRELPSVRPWRYHSGLFGSDGVSNTSTSVT
ncbi:ribbon-helix-helix protein, CopG family [Candidatus Gracilibacteria bacterium]|nr:ribbon-helix-helix protein, CopG family [Candidatus Gracilibacteria bacterium]